jgi:hypothetical protein
MPDVSRRQFLRHASIGAAAAGVFAVGGTGVVSAFESSGRNTDSQSVAEEESLVDGADVFARVVDARAGKITIFVGTRAIDYTDRALAQKLLKAAQ